MSPRKYDMGRRAELAEATRRAIVEATLALHIERGVLGTSMRDIAARADVAPGTVAHHFQNYEQVVTACRELVEDSFPPPTGEIFRDASTLPERVERLVKAWFRFHANLPHFQSLQADRAGMPPLDGFLVQLEEQHQATCREALGPRARVADTRRLRAMTDWGVWHSLTRAGLSTDAAARDVIAVLQPWVAQLGERSGQRKG